jgi:hypothetical protein
MNKKLSDLLVFLFFFIPGIPGITLALFFEALWGPISPASTMQDKIVGWSLLSALAYVSIFLIELWILDKRTRMKENRV